MKINYTKVMLYKTQCHVGYSKLLVIQMLGNH